MAKKILHKNISEIYPFLALMGVMLVVVAFSGCFGAKQCPVVVSQTNGVVVTRIAPSYNLVPVCDEITLTAEVQNKGTAAAKNVKATLWGHPGFGINEDEVKAIGTLNQPRLDICSAGDSKVMTWNLQAGCDPRETVFAVSVDYDYTADGWASIFMVSHDEAERTGGQFSVKGENNPSAGPVQVMIEPLQVEPIILTKTSSNFDARVKFKDLADGVVGTEGTGNLSEVKVTTVGPCVFPPTSKRIDGYVNSRTLILNQYYKNEVSLSAGTGEGFKILKLQYAGDDFSTFTKDFCRINVHAVYHYRSVESTKLPVGITGTASQVDECRSGCTPTTP